MRAGHDSISAVQVNKGEPGAECAAREVRRRPTWGAPDRLALTQAVGV